MFGLFDGISEAWHRVALRMTEPSDFAVQIVQEYVNAYGTDLLDWLVDYVIFDENTIVEVYCRPNAGAWECQLSKNYTGHEDTQYVRELILTTFDYPEDFDYVKESLENLLTEIVDMLRNEEIVYEI